LATLGDFRPTFGGVLASFGLFCPSLRRFLQAGSTFCGLFSQISFVGFLLPFLRSILDPFSALVRFAICLFYGTFSMSMVVWALFLGGFLTVHFIMIFATLGLMCLVAVLASCQS
jgi:hypothetical protein